MTGAKADAALALVALAAFVGSLVAVGASLSVPFFVAGGLGTIGFELLASRDPDLVRRCWERPVVQLAALALAIGAAAIGARVAPEPVLSALCGATITYLVLLASIRIGPVPPPRSW